MAKRRKHGQTQDTSRIEAGCWRGPRPRLLLRATLDQAPISANRPGADRRLWKYGDCAEFSISGTGIKTLRGKYRDADNPIEILSHHTDPSLETCQFQ